MGSGLLAFWSGGKQLPFLMGFYLQTDSPGPNSHEELQLSLLPGVSRCHQRHPRQRMVGGYGGIREKTRGEENSVHISAHLPLELPCLSVVSSSSSIASLVLFCLAQRHLLCEDKPGTHYMVQADLECLVLLP